MRHALKLQQVADLEIDKQQRSAGAAGWLLTLRVVSATVEWA
jgi:hypothetical protein